MGHVTCRVQFQVFVAPRGPPSPSMYPQGNAYAARSPPPLQHPIPTHPKVSVPEPPPAPAPVPGGARVRPARQPVPPHAAQRYPRPSGAPATSRVSQGYQRISSPKPPPPSGVSPMDTYGYAPPQRRGAPPSLGAVPRAPAASGVHPAANASASAVDPTYAAVDPTYAAMDSTYFDGGAPGAGVYAPPQQNMYPTGDATDDAWSDAGGTGAMPAFGAGVMNEATTQMGMQFGRHVAQVGGEYMQKNIRALVPMPVLKHYFNVSNSYVLHKLRIILFPWRHRPWSRKLRYATPYGSGIMSPGQRATPTPYAGMSAPDRPLSAGAQQSCGEPVSYCPPREDVNSPDMYIPFMAFVTYAIATSFIYGIRGRFHPEILGYTASRALAIVLVEFSVVKLGCYLLNIQGDHTIVDLLAYSGYKFVGTLLVLAVGVLQASRWVYWVTFFYVFAANAFFLLRSLRYVVLPDPSSPSSATVTQAQRTTRIQFLFGIAVSQIVFGWFLIASV
ncbi:Protein transport protein yif1 [Malassezia sp. CBS 17886]|nr:Protein transport protein yif1 [Malassezia sp. CBS 17886]